MRTAFLITVLLPALSCALALPQPQDQDFKKLQSDYESQKLRIGEDNTQNFHADENEAYYEQQKKQEEAKNFDFHVYDDA
ncbi:MAG: hypothetical protein M1837_005592 [Sclerophora amabilis]|nr:MAG: hypothetical protein M1837_005592 [Sclerophora amabilis]